MANVLVAAILGSDSMLHLFWGSTGSPWPARTPASLARGLLNVGSPMKPAVLLGLSATLAAAAALVLVQAGLLGGIGRRLPRRIPRLVTRVIEGAAVLRGIAGIVWVIGIGTHPGTPYYWLNLFVYMPVCVVLAVACRVIRHSPTGRRPGSVAGTGAGW